VPFASALLISNAPLSCATALAHPGGSHTKLHAFSPAGPESNAFPAMVLYFNADTASLRATRVIASRLLECRHVGQSLLHDSKNAISVSLWPGQIPRPSANSPRFHSARKTLLHTSEEPDKGRLRRAAEDA
jgi:hypothetical protein